MSSENAPARIESTSHKMPTDLAEWTILFGPIEATLKQNGNDFKGTVSVLQQWVPMVVFIEFRVAGENTVSCGRASVESSLFASAIDIDVNTILAHGVRAFAKRLEIGASHDLDNVTFQLPNYPDLFGGETYHDTIQTPEGTQTTSWSQLLLEADGWQIALQPCKDIHSLERTALERRVSVLSGVGEMRRSDGTRFKRADVLPILEALRLFLSFSFGRWCPPVHIVGANREEPKCWYMSNNYIPSPQWHLEGWIETLHSWPYLKQAFPGFLSLFKREQWKEPLELAITWLIEATERSSGTEGAIAIGQIPLEMLAWMVFVDERTIVSRGEFDRLSAASKLQMLLAHCCVPLATPSELTTLSMIASGQNMTGPELATRVRNTIIHPDKKNRQVLTGWAGSFGVTVSDIRWEVHQLFRWYITLVLLKMIDYRGRYVNRLTSYKLGQIDPVVPWTATASTTT